MNEFESELDDEEVVQMAVQALAAASQRASASGCPVVVVVDRQIVRRDASGTTVLEQLPPRQTVSVRVKKATN
jgi:20S proteasome alpha/beta subunit